MYEDEASMPAYFNEGQSYVLQCPKHHTPLKFVRKTNDGGVIGECLTCAAVQIDLYSCVYCLRCKGRCRSAVRRLDWCDKHKRIGDFCFKHYIQNIFSLPRTFPEKP